MGFALVHVGALESIGYQGMFVISGVMSAIAMVLTFVFDEQKLFDY